MLAHTLAIQARKPSGLLGRLFGMGMGRINRGVNAWVISLLELQPSDQVLEIGFGPGKALRAVHSLVPNGKVYGLDISRTMMEQAKRLNHTGVKQGTVNLQLGEAAKMPFPDMAFNKVFGVNVAYFWETPEIELKEIYRVCKPGGLVAIYIGDRHQMANVPMTKTGVFRLYGSTEFSNLLHRAGFVDVKSFDASIAQGPISKGSCVTARRPPNR